MNNISAGARLHNAHSDASPSMHASLEYHSKGQHARRHAGPAIKQLRRRAREVEDAPSVSCCWPWTHEPCHALSRRAPQWTRSEHKTGVAFEWSSWWRQMSSAQGHCETKGSSSGLHSPKFHTAKRPSPSRHRHYLQQDMPGTMQN